MINKDEIFDFNCEKSERKIINRIEESIKKEVEKLVKKEHSIYIEKIAFSLFIMFYYKQNFSLSYDPILLKTELKKTIIIWNLGKKENKLDFWLNLAELISMFNLNIQESS